MPLRKVVASLAMVQAAPEQEVRRPIFRQQRQARGAGGEQSSFPAALCMGHGLDGGWLHGVLWRSK